jgi:hypothetical protein
MAAITTVTLKGQSDWATPSKQQNVDNCIELRGATSAPANQQGTEYCIEIPHGVSFI